MHDSSEEELLRLRNQTMQMTKILVPRLKERGYQFVRLDEVPQIRNVVSRDARSTARRGYARN
jgi:hypothetical protein